MTAKAAATLCFCTSVSVFAAGCGHGYADFTLPVLAPAPNTNPPRLVFHPNPVLSGPVDSLNPSVVRFGGKLYNLYSNFDGHTWHTDLATSADGVSWSKRGHVISPDAHTWEGSYIAANGSVLVVGSELWYWYQAGERNSPRIGLAKSPDGRTWHKNPEPVLGFGPYRSWDERTVADPYVLAKNGWFYLYYLGEDRARQQQLGLARSRDGVRWEKLLTNPVVSLPLPGVSSADENGLGEPAVWEARGSYWMLHTGRSAHEERAVSLMRSSDGVRWAHAGKPTRGAEAWNAKVVCDFTVLGNLFWFGGGDVASPDENLHGQIGLGEIQ